MIPDGVILPTVGRVVHYYGTYYCEGVSGHGPYAAMITEIGSDGTVRWLHVFDPAGAFDVTAVPFSQVPAPCHWSWPPRVP